MDLTRNKGSQTQYYGRLLLIILFGIAMAYCEAVVVVYLRELFYPEGFSLPLKLIPRHFIMVELLRELATIVMLVTVSAVAARPFWERFGYFMILFGIWDIFFYVWLEAIFDWPVSLLDWDVLFLIPVPWIGPVIAAVLIAITMTGMGIVITYQFARGSAFKPTVSAWLLSCSGLGMLFYSFMRDTGATLHQQSPQPYFYWLFLTGLVLCLVAFFISLRSSANCPHNL